jgi:hypothetical protein
MSKSTILATARITAADDIITVTYVEPGDSPPVIIRYSLPQSREAVRHDCRS